MEQLLKTNYIFKYLNYHQSLFILYFFIVLKMKISILIILNGLFILGIINKNILLKVLI